MFSDKKVGSSSPVHIPKTTPLERSRSQTLVTKEKTPSSKPDLFKSKSSPDVVGTDSELSLVESRLEQSSPTKLKQNSQSVPLPKDIELQVSVLPKSSWKLSFQKLMGQIGKHFRKDFTPVPSGVQDTSSSNKISQFSKKIDPFGLLKAPEAKTDSAKNKYKNLQPNQWQTFLSTVSITGPTSSGKRARVSPSEGTLDLALNQPKETSSGVPKMQHSIWVGGPLKEGQSKHKAFMDQLVKNKENNPEWNVCLWTDQSREAMLSAEPESDLGKMRDWAIQNDISLIPVDEVFAGDNEMTLQGMYKTEQLKGGTGRAAASDIMRLEIITRFGGIYCDGDKPFNKPFDEIAKHTSENGGFTSAQESGKFQNCGMCGVPGNEVSQSVIENIQTNYGKPRNDLLDLDNPTHKLRPTRLEVILRTGPSIVRDVALGKDNLTEKDTSKSKHLMPKDFITPPTTYTTSWDPSKIPCHGDEDLIAMSEQNQTLDTSTAMKIKVDLKIQQTRQLAQAIKPEIDLSETEEKAQIEAVEKGVTALIYGVWNNDGLFNMDLAEQHIKSSPNPDLAREMILEVFASDEMSDITKQVKTIQLPGTPPNKVSKGSPSLIPESTLDAIFKSDLFPNLEVNGFTAQHAAFMGNVQFIDYAIRNNMLDLDAISSRPVEAGEHTGVEKKFVSGPVNVFQSALYGGQKEVLSLLSSQDGFGTWMKGQIDNAPNGKNNPIQEAAEYGQIDTALWCYKALASDDRSSVDLPDLLNKFLNVRKERNVPMNDEQKTYVFNTFYDSFQSEMGQAPPLNNHEVSMILKDAYFAGNDQLIASMESKGVSLDNLNGDVRSSMFEDLVSSKMDMGGVNRGLFRFAQKNELVTEMLYGQSLRHKDNLETVKNEHNVQPDFSNDLGVNSPGKVLEYLSKGFAYADDHLHRGQSGKSSRVRAWRVGVSKIVNHYGAIPKSQRTPEEQVLLETATMASQALIKVKT